MSDRTEARQAEAVLESPATKSPGIKAWIPLIAVVLLMPALAWAMNEFVLIPRIQKAIGAAPAANAAAAGTAGEHAEAEAPAGKGEKAGGKSSVTLSKLLVNVAGTMGSRYLLASVTLVGHSSDFKARVEKHDAQLRDAAMTLLSTKTITDLEKPGARNTVRSELLTAFNSIIGGNAVQEMYITEFAIQ